MWHMVRSAMNGYAAYIMLVFKISITIMVKTKQLLVSEELVW